MSRRARGEGTVLRDGDGWIARIDLPPGPNGERRRRKRRARTKTEALQKLKDLQGEVEAVANPYGMRRTVAEATRLFLDTQPRTGRSRKTIEIEESRARAIVEGLGKVEIGRLTVAQCDRFLADVRDGKFGRGGTLQRDSVRRIRSLLIRVLRNEIRIGNLATNPADLSVMPTFGVADLLNEEHGDSSSSTRRTLSADEFQRLYKAAELPLKLIVDLCGRNGLRPAEARALRWSRVDLAGGTVKIDAQLSSSDRVTKPKTRRSLRVVAIDDQTVDLLARWRELQNRSDDGDDLVVTSEAGTALDASNLRRSMSAACEQAGIDRYVPYELRHTAITFQVETGADVWRVADWAGTSDRMIEEIYRHRTIKISPLSPVLGGRQE